MEPTKIYVFCNSCEPNWHSVVAITEQGKSVASHVCSHHGFAPGDMGLVGTCEHDTYNKMFPDGWELVWVDDPIAHPVISALITMAKLKREGRVT